VGKRTCHTSRCKKKDPVSGAGEGISRTGDYLSFFSDIDDNTGSPERFEEVINGSKKNHSIFTLRAFGRERPVSLVKQPAG